MKKQIPCPVCKKNKSSKDDAIWPFCSERCKTNDLGAWAAGDYFITGESSTTAEDDPDGDFDVSSN